MQIIALANEDDQIIRPVFPNKQTLRVSGNDANSAEEAYNLQLLSVIFCGHNVVGILCTSRLLKHVGWRFQKCGQT